MKKAILILGPGGSGKTTLALTIGKLFKSPLVAIPYKFKNDHVHGITGITKETDLVIIDEVHDLKDFVQFLLDVKQFEVKGEWPAKINPSVIFISNEDLEVPEVLKECVTVYKLK